MGRALLASCDEVWLRRYFRAPRERDPVAWSVALYMGSQSLGFYMISTWLSPIEISAGRPAVEAGFDVALYQIAGIAGSLLLPLLYRGRLRRWLAAVLPIFIGLSFACIVLQLGPTLPWVVLGGIASGSSLSISLMFMAIRAKDTQGASALSGMAQAVGYLIAATGPAAFGLAHALSDGWIAPLCVLLTAMLAQLVIGLFVGRDRCVFDGEGGGSGSR